MGPYKVYYMNNYITEFAIRDTALKFIMTDANQNSRAIGDYEILDRSDAL